LYYAGCMTHLTPAIKKAMIRILDASGLNYRFLDEAGGVCCGRPLMLAGKDKEARELINFNSGLIRDSGARILVTSCPICYKVFRESYYLEVELMHHTQFIKMLIDEDMLRLRFLRKKVVYHAPCDLGRGSGIYDEPKDVLRHVARLQPTGFDDDDSLCCGGSLGNTRISYRQKNKIAADAASALTKGNPEILATACPLCKKTFTTVTDTRVADIAEIVAEAIAPNPPELKKHVVKELYREPADMI
ncbi:MAG TPA: (Fe-S)-binding protein, partial [Bacteroidales bacterium]|nr:(Fe-S)-binding protein [Bacteroidales bacterium]